MGRRGLVEGVRRRHGSRRGLRAGSARDGADRGGGGGGGLAEVVEPADLGLCVCVSE